MPQYSCTFSATSNTSINTADTFVELKAPASVVYKVKRFRVQYGDGTQTIGVDNHYKITIVRKSAGGATGTAGTAVKKDANRVAAQSTLLIKNAAAAFTTATITDTVDTITPNGRMIYEWLARDDDDMIQTLPAGIFAINIQSPVVSQLFTVTVEWLE